MEKHVTVLGVLYIALGCLGVLGALVVFTAVTGGGLLSGDETAILVTGAVGTAIASFLLLLSLPMIIGGIALLRHAPWARIFMLVLGALNLLNIPFGTILGIYTFWALTRPEIEAMFRRPEAVVPV